MTLSEVFYMSLMTVSAGLLIKLASLAYKSKCSEISCCGISIKRRVDLETADEPVETPKINNIV